MIPVPRAEPAARIYRVGTLTYTKAALALLFLWLLGGDFIYIIINNLEPRVLPVLLKQYGATDQQIAIIVSSIPALINFVVNPIVSYRSDRTRSRWGRRTPYLLLATPFVSLFLALTPFAPELAKFTHHLPWLGSLRHLSPWPSVLIAFAVLVVLYQAAQMVITPIYIYLFRDVVPAECMGRFLALMRVFSALGTFALNYWLVGLVENHSRAIFVGVAIVNLIGFLGVCWFVEEGAYPPVVETITTDRGAARFGLVRAMMNFVAESFTSRIYWWTFVTRLLIYATIPTSAFLIFFAQHEVGMTIDQAGKILAWPSLAWLIVAYPVGRLADRWGAIRTLTFALWIIATTYALSFFGVVGERTFFVSALVTGVAYWMVMLTQLMLAQEVFPSERMGQLCAANTMVQSLIIAFVTAPLSGWLLYTCQDWHYRCLLPIVGVVQLGPYRLINLFLAAIYFGALLALYRLRSQLQSST